MLLTKKHFSYANRKFSSKFYSLFSLYLRIHGKNIRIRANKLQSIYQLSTPIRVSFVTRTTYKSCSIFVFVYIGTRRRNDLITSACHVVNCTK